MLDALLEVGESIYLSGGGLSLEDSTRVLNRAQVEVDIGGDGECIAPDSFGGDHVYLVVVILMDMS